ncbi:MAG: YbhB/YbcL family Raf kinase inhibitor-like protein [Cyanobacteria bacterium J069]|nr:MAG: YbhB/YbcL family Raf kinase inhibitor-like protein [Cyanobacteria bacterium J069]
MTIRLTSAAFSDGQPIPTKYTCDGENISPPLSWEGVPDAATTLALIAEDPDAPFQTWVHWVLYDLPTTTTKLPEGLPTQESVLAGAKQGKNDFKKIGYGGPCPPGGKAHRYQFKLYALGKPLKTKAIARKNELEAAMKGHVLAIGILTGTYKRN